MVDAETEASAVARVMEALDEGRGGLMVTVNLDHVRRCQTDARYRDLVARSELVVADGMPLVWKSRVQGTPLPERVAGSSLIWPLCRACADQRRSVYLLGGDPGAGDAAKEVLEKRFPGLRVCGVASPERGFEHDEARMAALERDLVASGADVVFVALGSPKQEYVADRLRRVMPRAWFIGCGITLSFVAGQVKRAPRWVQRCGMEWAHRLVQEPRRLARRYLIDGMPFAASLLVRAAWRRITGQGRVRHDELPGLLPSGPDRLTAR
jgi:N-acetylglucosaminyldiphosphoundecaprenol N-acetyl-beta-D-mannosaminyltransferase